jgi:hypothetical protein
LRVPLVSASSSQDRTSSTAGVSCRSAVLTLFDKQPLDQLLAEIESGLGTVETRNQLNLFPDISGQ